MAEIEIPSSFEADGFVVLEDLISDQVRGSLIEEFERLRLVSGGHSLRNVHVSPLVRQVADGVPASLIAKRILGSNAKLVRAIFFDKVAGANWSVPWHQDLTIAVKERDQVPGYGPWSLKDGVVHVQPPATVLESMVTIRLQLDDCLDDNGPVRVKPGSHLNGKITESLIETWDAPEVSCVGKAGSVLLMRPLILHASSPATSPSHRRVLHLEYAGASLAEPLEWYLA